MANKKKNTTKKSKDKKSRAINRYFDSIPGSEIPAELVSVISDEIAKNVINRLPKTLPIRSKKRKNKKIENAVFLDTSAIIDGRIFEIFNLGVMSGNVVIPESILLELKRIADSQDTVKRERGQRGLSRLDDLKKTKGVKVIHLPEKTNGENKKEVDDKLIDVTKQYKGKVITCDYNLEKKASISGIVAININTLANHLKIQAVPGEALHIKVLHKGKDMTQGVGYLDDGTMLVIENASEEVGKDIDVIVSRVIQTSAGRILFSKKI